MERERERERENGMNKTCNIHYIALARGRWIFITTAILTTIRVFRRIAVVLFLSFFFSCLTILLKTHSLSKYFDLRSRMSFGPNIRHLYRHGPFLFLSCPRDCIWRFGSWNLGIKAKIEICLPWWRVCPSWWSRGKAFSILRWCRFCRRDQLKTIRYRLQSETIF